MSRELGEVRPVNRAAWRRWLAANHAISPGVWLIWRKKTAKASDLTLEAAVEEALCFGWIDSVLNPIDAQTSKLRFTPRRPKSTWSRHTKSRIQRMIERGLMTEAGLRVIEAAKRNGSWDAMSDVDALKVPDDLAAALTATPRAARRFEESNATRKRAILWSVLNAKRPETRARRIAAAVRELGAAWAN